MSVNKVILIGNLTKDPEVRFMPSGGAVANITVATSERWKDKNTGEQKEKSEFHRVAIFGKLAEIAGEYLTKGSKIYIEGQLQTRKWQNQQGQDQYTTEVVVQGFNGVMQMLDSRGSGQAQSQQPPQQGFQQPQQQGGYQQPVNPQAASGFNKQQNQANFQQQAPMNNQPQQNFQNNQNQSQSFGQQPQPATDFDDD